MELQHVAQAGVERDVGELDGDQAGIDAFGVDLDYPGELAARPLEQLAAVALEVRIGQVLHAGELAHELVM